jgi:hypothetical protein
MEDMKATGCHPYEVGEAQQAAASAAREYERKLDASVDEAVERSINELTL